MPARNDSLAERLLRFREVTITVNGRKSGRVVSIPVWFVFEAGKLFLLRVKGSETQRYKNVLANPSIVIDARGAEAALKAAPITELADVKPVIDKISRQVWRGRREKVLFRV